MPQNSSKSFVIWILHVKSFLTGISSGNFLAKSLIFKGRSMGRPGIATSKMCHRRQKEEVLSFENRELRTEN